MKTHTTLDGYIIALDDETADMETRLHSALAQSGPRAAGLMRLAGHKPGQDSTRRESVTMGYRSRRRYLDPFDPRYPDSAARQSSYNTCPDCKGPRSSYEAARNYVCRECTRANEGPC